MSEEIKDENKIIEESVGMFFQADSQVAGTNMSRGSVIRAIRYALHNNLTDKVIKLKNDEEKKLAFYFMLMLDNRMIMQAKLLSDLEKKSGDNKEGEL